MKIFYFLCFIFLTSVFVPQSYAQRNQKRLINVPVAVSDREGHYIAGLRKEDFSVFQDGVKQEIVSFETEEEPVSVAILIDASRSTDKILGKIKDAAQNFIKLLNPKDQSMIATFDSDVNILNQFTSDKAALETSIDRIKVNEKVGTVLHRAINQIVKNSFASVKGRKALIVLTDGKDFGSYMTRSELIDSLQETDVMIYTVFYNTGIDFSKPNSMPTATADDVKKKKKKSKKKSGFSLDIPDGDFPSEEEVKLREKRDDQEAIDALKRMSDATAGRFYNKEITDLKSTFEQIADELRKQYRLSYYAAESGKNSAHELLVKINRPDAVVRTREGFRLK
ncbi:MAG: VWA domain-containing protein [Pyrinomonadaceae bacterium]